MAIQGGDVVGQVVNTMKAINDSSKKIVDIIDVCEWARHLEPDASLRNDSVHERVDTRRPAGVTARSMTARRVCTARMATG